jgi:hypothetical protein
MSMTNQETISYLRGKAAALGCTLKRQRMTINNAPAYKYVVRRSDDVLISNMTLGIALDNMESGALERAVKFNNQK